jgi:hypothetical protein
MTDHADTRVGWIFSLIRSGSSATAYGAAAPWEYRVADEVMGPWVRTGPIYQYPPVQGELVEAFKRANWTLGGNVLPLTRQLMTELSRPSGGVVSKHPHLDFEPEDFKRAFPDYGAIYLIRNPLHRLNSIYARGLYESLRPNHELDHFKTFATRWLRQPEGERLVFDDLKRNPKAYYRRIFEAWRWAYEEADLDKAAAYTSGHYHASCKELETSDPGRPMSESAASLPDEAIDAYLADPFIVDLMTHAGWSLDAESYRRLASAKTA